MKNDTYAVLPLSRPFVRMCRVQFSFTQHYLLKSNHASFLVAKLGRVAEA